jgi:hypothetical protein
VLENKDFFRGFLPALGITPNIVNLEITEEAEESK